MFAVLGSPTQAFVDAIKVRLDADATLMALVSGVFGHVSDAARVAYPYVVLGSTNLDEGSHRSMGVAGGRVELQIDVFSQHGGRSEAQSILSRVRALLDRHALAVGAFTLMAGSLRCEMETVDREFDEDAPGKSLYHGIQRWVAEIDEATR